MAMANAGTNKFALGLDAPEYDQLARSLAVSSKQRAVWTPTSSHSDGGSLDAGGAGGASEDEGGRHISRSGGADGHHVSLHQGGPFDTRQERVLKSLWIQHLFKTRPPTRQPTRPPTGGLRTRPPTGRTRPPTRRPSSSPVILSSSPTPPPSVGPTAQPSAKPMSSSPSASPTISPSVSPTNSPSSSPTASPSVSPSLSPSGSPSVKPSVSFKFTTNAELRTAIREYLSQGCPDDANCQAHSDYGDTIGDWDVSRVEDFSRLFVDDSFDSITGAAEFNEPINWDTGSATRMSYMFLRAMAFNQPLLSFDTAEMFSMFGGATAFNQPLSLDTAKVTGVSEFVWSPAETHSDFMHI
ncbi:hypothetical protein THAOC_37298 [Thalassiosira oceanica]|uniref:BspA family leucine-rich repeat surface protein n=1 Tax=Thalassiosira oceanica TaxID=159749 RepID=K0R6I4_THAOC|nr:hypothetical protein THAOC_37298 [Thalassiosira oceanica]|eukprot:EJK44186.1 hypothetical protein THAOC_37298 [Thalassiosira oceanica]